MDQIKDDLLEKEVKDMFEEAGWELKPVETPQGSFRPDFEIFSEGKSYGYAEMYDTTNPKVLVAKVNKVKKWLDGLRQKPLLFVLTDGFEFHISEYGEPFEEYHFVPGPTSYPVLTALIKDYAASLLDKWGGK